MRRCAARYAHRIEVKVAMAREHDPGDQQRVLKLAKGASNVPASAPLDMSSDSA